MEDAVISQELNGEAGLDDATETSEALRVANGRLHGELAYFKSMIAQYDRTARSWNVCKRMTNKYELVCSGDAGGVPRISPTSRSYFKMWEMLKLSVPTVVTRASRPLRMAFLAEAPGGFVESVAEFRKEQACLECLECRECRECLECRECRKCRDAMHCITLIDPQDSHVPSWSKMRSILDTQRTTVVLHAGADGTGDLYRIANIDHFVRSVGAGSCDLVTADGGFDVSSDYNMQEVLSLRLILCEAYTMLRVQRRGGASVLKVFDVSHVDTLRILRILGTAYDNVKLVKPLSSRPANSEKYVVCAGFHGAPDVTLACMREAIVRSAVAALRGTQWSLAAVPILSRLDERHFLKRVLMFNTAYISRQIEYIQRTLSLIHRTSVNATDTVKSTMITREYHRCATRRRQVSHAVKWCMVHGVPFGT